MARIFGGHLIELTDEQVTTILDLFAEVKGEYSLTDPEEEVYSYLKWVTNRDTDS